MSKLEGYSWKPISDVLAESPPPSAGASVAEHFPGALGYWCRFFMAVTVSKMIEDAIIINHGPLGCNGSVRTFITDHYTENFGQGFLHLASTNMDQNSVIFGGEKDLERTIKEVDRDYKPPVIIVHDNCCADIIRDDIGQIVEMVQPEVKAKVVWVPSPGFTTCFADNMSMNMPHYVQLMDEPKKVDKDAVNIIGVYKEVFSGCGQVKKDCKQHGDGYFTEWERKYPTDTAELARYVEALGLKVHRVLMAGKYDYVRTAPEAGLNVHNCPAWGYPLGKEMQKRFGTPMAKQAFPIGLEATKSWIYEIAELTGREKEANVFVKSEEKQLLPLWNKARNIFAGKVALIEGVRNALCATTKGLAMARLAMELGMHPYIFNLQGVFVSAKDYVVNYFTQEGINPPMLDGPYTDGFPVSIEDVIKDLGLKIDEVVYFPTDVYDYARAGRFDASNVTRVDTGQPFRRVKHAPRYLGYRGTAGILRDMIEAEEVAKRGNKPTLYGRLFGEQLDFPK